MKNENEKFESESQPQSGNLSMEKSVEGAAQLSACRREAAIYLLLSLFWMGMIFAFSHQAYSGRITEEYLGDLNIPVRKLGHVTEFAVLSLLYLNTLLGYFANVQISKISSRGDIAMPRLAKFALLALTLAFLYACTDEWHQSFVPGRSSTFIDVLVDTSGVVVAMGLRLGISWLRSKLARKKHPSAQSQ